MKSYKRIVLGLCLCIAASAWAEPLNKEVQVDILMGKITSLLQANKEADALPYFAELETMGTQLPESFYFYYIEALQKSGSKEKTLSRAEDYLNRYGKAGKYYGKVIPIVSSLSIEVEKGRFREEGSVIVDSKTGLQWSQSDNGEDINWNEATSYCSNIGGGWRLPSIGELQAIIDPSLSVSCGPTSTCRISPKFRLTEWIFWTNERAGSSEAWFAGLVVGNRGAFPVERRHHHRALCVRRP